ncbi:hypothetical protein C8N46_102413 [Kordia periserrulae]|uniref:Uncharacterized protein n=1 Tax=Kordia periserrulae TaxID=701523 RepID=A0A2T6C3X8_9FLAO|nr:hypothetical protein [Kordia periserrulae]PTX63012.1 hypothetical protein C8N46_102413 [Kordia periserrulae]
MKKQHLQSLRLNKISISKFEIQGGLAPRGESEFNTVCPMCETEDCPTKNEDR